MFGFNISKIVLTVVAILTIINCPRPCCCAPTADPGLYLVPAPDRTEFLVGGWGPGDTPKNFLRRYKPIFQDYLTQQIGSLYQPPISFKLIATDWGADESTTSHVMVENGELDFVCKDHELPLKLWKSKVLKRCPHLSVNSDHRALQLPIADIWHVSKIISKSPPSQPWRPRSREQPPAPLARYAVLLFRNLVLVLLWMYRRVWMPCLSSWSIRWNRMRRFEGFMISRGRKSDLDTCFQSDHFNLERRYVKKLMQKHWSNFRSFLCLFVSSVTWQHQCVDVESFAGG